MPPLFSIFLGEGHNVTVFRFYIYSANFVTQPGESLAGDAVEIMSQPAKSPRYAKVATRSPEQVEVIKAAGAERQPLRSPQAAFHWFSALRQF